MRFLSWMLAAWAMVASAWAGDILIYKGVSAIQTDLSQRMAYQGPVLAYCVLDPDTKEIVTLLAYKIGGHKMQAPTSSATTIRLDVANVPQAKTVTLLSLDTATNDANGTDYSYLAFFLRGVNSTLTIRNAPIHQVNRPRVLTGTLTNRRFSMATAFFQEAKFNLVFQGKRTVAANKVNQTLLEARDEIVDDLEKLGYERTPE